MFVMREVVQCQPGKVGEMVKKFKGLSQLLKQMGYKPFRLMTDVSGEHFWTIVAETEAESLDAFGQMEEKAMANEEARKLMTGYHELVKEGRREFYKLEAS